jgi:hypothetical protein
LAEPYLGSVARIRLEMERERAAAALSGLVLPDLDNCALSQRVLRERLFVYHGFAEHRVLGGQPRHYRPWRLGTDMVGPAWMWKGVGRVLRDREFAGLVEVWTRKAHRAWRKETYTIRSLASAILRGEVRDPW